MEPYGDPEARIRDLERPLADRAGASELGTRPYEATTPPPPDIHQAHPYGQYGTPQYTSPYYSAPERVVRKRSHTAALWVIPLAVVAFLGAGVAGIVFYANLGSPDSFTENPTPPIAGGGGSLDAPPTGQAVPSFGSTEETVTVEAGGFASIGGVDKDQTVICNGGTVNISGVNNTIEIRGSCAGVTVSGIENDITVDSAEMISASGFDNRITYSAGVPEISQSGTGNIIEQG
jgi:hypothetical protein